MTTETTPTNDTPADATEAGTTTALGDAAAQNDAAPEDETSPVDDKPAGEAKAGDNTDDSPKDDTPADGAPESYDTSAWKMPEGVEFDADGFKAIEPVLRDLNLTNDQAGSLMQGFGEKIAPMLEQRFEQRMNDAAAEIGANLARELQADPEVGGAKLKESQAHAAKAISHGIPNASQRAEFSQFLNESGLGNHPLLTRVLASAGRALSEASVPAGQVSGEKSAAEVFYGRKG